MSRHLPRARPVWIATQAVFAHGDGLMRALHRSGGKRTQAARPNRRLASCTEGSEEWDQSSANSSPLTTTQPPYPEKHSEGHKSKDNCQGDLPQRQCDSRSRDKAKPDGGLKNETNAFGVEESSEAHEWCLRGLTFEVSRRPAVGAQLDRGVRPHARDLEHSLH